MQIYELKLTELHDVYDVIKELHISLEYDDFEDLIYQMSREGYKMFGLYEKGDFITYAGVEVAINLYHGHHLYIHELVTKSAFRSRGFGSEMLIYLNDYAKMLGCERLILSSALHRKEAHAYYEKAGFLQVGKQFCKELI